jgi:F0F1-type ATP synthase assembly protein I
MRPIHLLVGCVLISVAFGLLFDHIVITTILGSGIGFLLLGLGLDRRRKE